MKTTKKLTALMAAFIFALAFAVVKPVKVQAADYTVTVQNGGVYDELYNPIFGGIADGTQVYVYFDITSLPHGTYIKEVKDTNTGTIYSSNPITVTGDLALEAVTAPYEEYVIDISSGTAVIDFNVMMARPFIFSPVTIPAIGNKVDVNEDGIDDLEIIAVDVNLPNVTVTVKKLDTCSIPYIFTSLPGPGRKYGKVVYINGNTGENTNPANDGGATTGETPADPAKADPKKAPKTGESNAFVLSMLGIIAVAGMGLYVGKRQEN